MRSLHRSLFSLVLFLLLVPSITEAQEAKDATGSALVFFLNLDTAPRSAALVRRGTDGAPGGILGTGVKDLLPGTASKPVAVDASAGWRLRPGTDGVDVERLSGGSPVEYRILPGTLAVVILRRNGSARPVSFGPDSGSQSRGGVIFANALDHGVTDFRLGTGPATNILVQLEKLDAGQVSKAGAILWPARHGVWFRDGAKDSGSADMEEFAEGTLWVATATEKGPVLTRLW